MLAKISTSFPFYQHSHYLPIFSEYILSHRQNKYFYTNGKTVILNQLKQAKERISRENLWCFMDEMAYIISYLTLS